MVLLPDREVGMVEAWLTRHPEISTIAYDRAGGNAHAASTAAPKAVQVADRWHLMENVSAAFLEAVWWSMCMIRQTLGCASADPALLMAAERLQYDGHPRRKAEAVATERLRSSLHSTEIECIL